ncbi:MAG: CehA/McbA family metallohydrolase, partial [Halieaceae bacterium]|nr:CehA/McbA family metallohydrolase [Halieaceae bacterium]
GPEKTVEIRAGNRLELDHRGLQAPGTLAFNVVERGSGRALDARISVRSGYKPLIKFLGDKTFFTELKPVGHSTLLVAPGQYEFDISAGGGFTAPVQGHSVQVESGATRQVKVEVPVQSHPARQHWYAIDLHHHSDVLDGFTAPDYVLRSELAAGMDFSFLSDHDSMVNNPEMKRLSSTRSIPFLAATELSPSWAHFNVYPVAEEAQIDIDVGAATVQEVFSLGRRLGAELVHVNHPYGDYGYFDSLETEVVRDGKGGNAVPGGYDPGFDLVEITIDDNAQTLAKVWQLWNVGHRAYLVGGSDVHDVWNEKTGRSRSYVYIEDEPTLERLVSALKQGHSFATQGPLIFPRRHFGSELKHPAGEALSLSFELAAVSGLKSVALIEQGRAIQTRDFEGTPSSAAQVFTVHPRSDTWYSLVVEDSGGKFAYSNPLWITVLNQ